MRFPQKFRYSVGRVDGRKICIFGDSTRVFTTFNMKLKHGLWRKWSLLYNFAGYRMRHKRGLACTCSWHKFILGMLRLWYGYRANTKNNQNLYARGCFYKVLIVFSEFRTLLTVLFTLWRFSDKNLKRSPYRFSSLLRLAHVCAVFLLIYMRGRKKRKIIAPVLVWGTMNAHRMHFVRISGLPLLTDSGEKGRSSPQRYL